MVANSILLGISSLAAGARPFFQKEVLEKVNAFEFMSLQIVLFTIIAIIALWKFKTLDKIKQFDSKTWIYFFVSIVVSMVSMLIYFRLIHKERPALVMAIFYPLSIIFTVLVGWLFFHDKITIMEGVGMAVIIVGIILMNYKTKENAVTPSFAASFGVI